MLLQVPTVSSSLFTHDREKRKLVAEISDLGLSNPFSRLYDDAIDVGFALKNPKTENITYWAYHDVCHDPDGDVVYWKFYPLPESVRKNPSLAGYSLELFND